MEEQTTVQGDPPSREHFIFHKTITALRAVEGMIMRFILMMALLLPTACCRPVPSQGRSVLPLIDTVNQRVRRQKSFVYLDPSAFNKRPFGVIEQSAVPVACDALKTSIYAPFQANFQGTVEALLAAVASRTGYRWRFEGSRPAAPILVSVNRDRASAYAILEEGLLQAQGLVTLRIDRAGRWMTLHYNRRRRHLLTHLDDPRF